MGIEDALGFFGFFLATFPLTTAVAIIVAIALSGARAHFMVWVGITAAVLYIATAVGNYLGLGALGISPADIWATYPDTRMFVVNTLKLYMLVYGVWTFMCTFIAGTFIAWAWFKMEPHS